MEKRIVFPNIVKQEISFSTHFVRFISGKLKLNKSDSPSSPTINTLYNVHIKIGLSVKVKPKFFLAWLVLSSPAPAILSTKNQNAGMSIAESVGILSVSMSSEVGVHQPLQMSYLQLINSPLWSTLPVLPY